MCMKLWVLIAQAVSASRQMYALSICELIHVFVCLYTQIVHIYIYMNVSLVSLQMPICMCVCMYIYIYVYIYIFLKLQRERERETKRVTESNKDALLSFWPQAGLYSLRT